MLHVLNAIETVSSDYPDGGEARRDETPLPDFIKQEQGEEFNRAEFLKSWSKTAAIRFDLF